MVREILLSDLRKTELDETIFGLHILKSRDSNRAANFRVNGRLF